MNRFQKKCLMASAMLHALLLLVLVVGTAFFNKEEKISSAQVIELVPGLTVTDGPTRGNSAPASAPAPIPTAAAPKPEVVLPKPAPEKVEQPKETFVEPPKAKPIEKPEESELPTPKPVKKTMPKPVVISKPKAKPAETKRVVDISKPTVRNNKEKQASAEAAEKAAEKHARDQRVAAVNGSLKNLGKKLSDPTSFDSGSFSGGGQAEINYGDFVLSKYDAAWIAPAEVDDSEAIVKARVVIARSGNVVSSEIIKASRNATLDKSVRRALDSVSFIQRFPEGSTDSQRTYIINFNLKTKRGIG